MERNGQRRRAVPALPTALSMAPTSLPLQSLAKRPGQYGSTVMLAAFRIAEMLSAAGKEKQAQGRRGYMLNGSSLGAVLPDRRQGRMKAQRATRRKPWAARTRDLDAIIMADEGGIYARKLVAVACMSERRGADEQIMSSSRLWSGIEPVCPGRMVAG